MRPHQFMFGPDLLVAPVTQAGATSRTVYLPAGASWTNLATGEPTPGGQTVVVRAPIDVIPVFARDGRHAELVGEMRATLAGKP